LNLDKVTAPHLRSKPIARAFAELSREVLYSAQRKVDGMLDILDVDLMDEDFFLEWISFYGVDLSGALEGTLDRNVIRRFRAVLKKRGQLSSIKYMVSSGGGLFLSEPIDIELYHWFEVPESITTNPESGIIYVKTSDKRAFLESNMLELVTPAGYKYSLTFSNFTQGVEIPSEVLNLQKNTHKHLTVDAEPEVTKQLMRRIEGFITTHKSVFNQKWSHTGAYKNGYSYARILKQEGYSNTQIKRIV